jgi:hypothetical protein
MSPAKQTPKKQAPKEDWIETDLPVVSTLKNCRQISKTHWEGIDVDGAILRVQGTMPAKRRLLVSLRRLVPFRTGGGYTAYGFVRLILAA